MKIDEEKIISLLKQGDNSAYKYIYNHHYALLCSVAYEYVKDTFVSETIVDDLIFHLWEKRETITINTSLRAYLIRSTRNRCINYLNLEREKRETTFSAMNTTQESQAFYLESLEYPLGTLLEKELENEVMQAIENLPKETRKVFRMSRWEGKHYEQIAEELGISVNTVKYHMKNALARLSKDLSKYLIAFLLFFRFLT